MCAMGIAVYVCISFLFFFLNKKEKRKITRTRPQVLYNEAGVVGLKMKDGVFGWALTGRSIYV
jgi:hypothetical protein